MISIDIDDTGARAAIDAAARLLKQPKRLYGVLGEVMIGQHKDRFDAQRAPDGRPWQPLKPWYRDAKGGGKILSRRGQLRNTLAYNAGERSLQFGSPLVYAAVHQFGAVIRPKRARLLNLGGHGFARKVSIPARPWLGVSESDGRELEQTAADLLRRALKGR